MTRFARLPALLACLFIITTSTARAQGAAPGFTAEDMLKVTTYNVLDLSDHGRRVAVAARRGFDSAVTDHARFGDPTYVAPANVRLLVVDTTTGTTQEPMKGLANIRRAAWSPDGNRLALLVVSERATRPPAFSTSLQVWDADRAVLSTVALRDARVLDAGSDLEWSPDGARVVVTVRDPGDERDVSAKFAALTAAPVIVHSSSDPFLDWDGLRRTASLRAVAEVTVATGAVRDVVPRRTVANYRVGRDGSFLTFMDDVTAKTDYDVIGGRVTDLRFAPLSGGDSKLVAKGAELKELQLRWSDDGRAFAYAKKGEVFVQRVEEEKPRSLTPPSGKEPEAPKAEATTPGKDEKDQKESFAVVSFSRDGGQLLVTSKKGWYVVAVSDGARRRLVTLDEEDEEKNPRLQAVDWSPDSASIYLTRSERDRWDRGLMRLDVATGEMTPLVKDSRLFGDFRMSRDGSTFVFTASNGYRPAELHVARLARRADGRSATLDAPKPLTSANAWVADAVLPRSELVSYRDTDGKVLYGVLRYPVGYEKGKRYPTVFEIYETFFDNGFNARATFLAGHGYAVFHPSVNLVTGRPGDAWVKGVTAAANRLIDMGVADPDRLGVHGTSYGGYATVLLLTQTTRFKAAVNISGKVNMVSFYTDSPRLGVRNTHAPEKSQDRIGGTLWDYPERYLEHSAVLRADRITTPLLCITGDQDPNVPASQSREIYYALRRLGKDVEWVRYATGGHRPPNSVAESVDFETRIVGWYDRYLKKK